MPNGFPGLIVLCFFGTCGFLLFKKIGIPLSALLGSLCASALLAVTGNFPVAPVNQLSAVCKVLIGIMVGRKMNRNSLRLLGNMLGPALLISVWMIALSVVSGLLLHFMSGLPLSTALIGSTTGGVSEMAIFALSKHYDVATITVIGVTRLVATLFFTPWLARKWSEKLSCGNGCHSGVQPVPEQPPLPHFSRPGILLLVACSFAGGILFDRLGVPAGLMVGALAASSAMSLITGRTYSFPPLLLAAAQIGIGIAIARQFGPQQLQFMLQFRFAVSVTVSSALTICGTLVLARLLHKITGMDPLTCLLSTSAGGLSQMIVVAEEMQADSLTISILHLARYIAIVSCMPILITLFLS